MTITRTKAPDIPNPAYPRGGYPQTGRVGPAWAAMWKALETATAAGRALDGKELAEKLAPKHDLSAQTLTAILSRAAVAGILSKESKPVMSKRGNRNRTFYRIKGGVQTDD
jgi:hypothetical protein